jgi:hypothetical protein
MTFNMPPWQFYDKNGNVIPKKVESKLLEKK